MTEFADELAMPSLRQEKPQIYISFFGQFTLQKDNRYIFFRNKKAKELLAFLICNSGKPINKQKLAYTLWPLATYTHAMDSLYKVCNYLKAFVENEIYLPIIFEKDALRFENSNVICDTDEFEKLYQHKSNPENCKKALALYKGEFLIDEAYEWTEEYEAYFDVRYLEMLDFLIEYYTKQGDHRKAAYYIKKHD